MDSDQLAGLQHSTEWLPQPFTWLEIPAGQVTLEETAGFYGNNQTFEVTQFAIAKYPVTNAQFREFVKAGGYREKKWWTEAGWEAREQGWRYDDSGLIPSKEPWLYPRYWGSTHLYDAEQPVVGISWYEAVAFCQWLSDACGKKIHLPTEIEWQWAAGGDDDRDYPWGYDWDASCCNHFVHRNGIGLTTPVRQYEGMGDSPFGVVDMAGNIWEWCLTAHKSGENSINGDNKKRRILRGGAFFCREIGIFRVGYREWDVPHFRNHGRGFRLACLLVSSG